MNQMPEKIFCHSSLNSKEKGWYQIDSDSRAQTSYIRSDLHEEEVEKLKQLLHWSNDMLLDCRRVIGECNDCDESVGLVCEVCNDNNAILSDIQAALEKDHDI